MPNTETKPAMLSVVETAAILGIHPDTVRVGIRENEIPALKVGRRHFVARAWLEKVTSAADAAP